MEGKMNWSGVELQIETLVPGVIAFAELALIFNCPVTLPAWLATGFTNGVVVVAVAYGVGALLIPFSRFIVDAVSERGPRAVVFEYLAHGNRKELIALCNEDPKFKDDYEIEKRSRMWKIAAEWNAVYRSAVRTSTRREEVDRRRSQGRLLRALFIPGIVAAGMLSYCATDDSPCKWFSTGFGCIFAALVMVFLYAYAELTVFAEAHDVSPAVENGEGQPE